MTYSILVAEDKNEYRALAYVALLLLFLAVAIYSSGFEASWHYDDFQNIVENDRIHIKDLSWENLKRTIYSPTTGKLSRPLAYLSFALNYYFDGLNVFSYHLVNLFIHYMTSFILFIFIYRTLKLPSLAAKYGRHAYFIALLSAVSWMINPIHVSAVTYIVQRMTSMAALFYIIAMYGYLKARTAEKGQLRKGLYFALTVLAALAAIGTKENAVMLPVSLLLYELLLIQGITTKERLKVYILPGFITIFIVLGLSMVFVDYSIILNSYDNRPFTLLQRLLTEPRIIIFYITLLLYPISSRLTLIHDVDISHSLFDPWTTLPAILFITITVLFALIMARRRPLITFCILFFLLNHLIEGSFVPLEIIYEHRNYIPSLFFFLPFSIAIINLCVQFKERKTILIAMSVFLVGVIIIQGTTTFLQNGIWKNEITLWKDNVRKAPNLHRPHHNLGVALMSAGFFEEGVRELKIALTSKDDAMANQKYVTYYHLGRYYFFFKDYNKAAWHFQQTLQWAPLYPEPYHYLAKIMCINGHLNDAESLVNQSIALKNESNFHITHGLIRIKAGDAAGAIEAANRSLNRAGDNRRAHALLALAYRLKNDDKSAAHHDQFSKGISISCTQLQ